LAIVMRVDLSDYNFDRVAPHPPRKIHLYTSLCILSPSLNSCSQWNRFGNENGGCWCPFSNGESGFCRERFRRFGAIDLPSRNYRERRSLDIVHYRAVMYLFLFTIVVFEYIRPLLITGTLYFHEYYVLINETFSIADHSYGLRDSVRSKIH